MKIWLTNGHIAWEIPHGRIASFYLWGYYLCPADWRVTKELDGDGWYQGDCGEMRNRVLEMVRE